MRVAAQKTTLLFKSVPLPEFDDCSWLSGPQYFLGFPWRLEVLLGSYFDFRLWCNKNREAMKAFRCEAAGNLFVVHPTTKDLDKGPYEILKKAYEVEEEYGSPRKSHLPRPSREYVQNGCVTIRVELVVDAAYGGRILPAEDFSEPMENVTNAVLVVKPAHGKTESLHVCRALLVAHSPVFRQLFQQNLQKEVQVEKLEDFVDFLRLVHPVQQQIKDDNVEKLLELAKKFEMKTTTNKLEDWLISCDSEDNYDRREWKLHLADSFELPVLLSIKSKGQLLDIKNSEEFYNFSKTTLQLLFERFLEL